MLLLVIAISLFQWFQIAFTQDNGTVGACIAATGYGWANNSIGQDPCTVAHDLFATDPQPCNILIDVPFGPLTPGNYYPAPGTDDANACLCNTVIYSLASACGLCQNATFLYWSEWIIDCPANETVYQQWPANIASDTEIPKWAYMALVNGFWDGPQAQANASAVATQVTTQTSSQSATASQHTATTTNAPTPSPSTSPPPSTDSKSPNNAGFIAGGVVGGVVAGAIISFLCVFFWRRRSLKPTYEPTPQTETWELPRSPPAMVSAVPNPRVSVSRQYNPNDPSTFPPSSGVPSNSTWTASGLYTGAPEL